MNIDMILGPHSYFSLKLWLLQHGPSRLHLPLLQRAYLPSGQSCLSCCWQTPTSASGFLTNLFLSLQARLVGLQFSHLCTGCQLGSSRIRSSTFAREVDTGQLLSIFKHAVNVPFREERKPGSVPTGPRPSPEGDLFRKLKVVRSCRLISLENRTLNGWKVRTSPNPDRQRKPQLLRGNLRCFINPCMKRNFRAHIQVNFMILTFSQNIKRWPRLTENRKL